MVSTNLKLLVLALSVLQCYGKSFIPDFLADSACYLNDDVCIAGLWTKSIKGLIAGQPELNIPPLDPLKVENVVINVPGDLATVNFSGVLKGIKDCVFENAHKTIKKGYYKQEVDIRCNVVLKGRYVALANSSVLFNTDGGLLKGDGHAKVIVDNLKIKFLLDFDIVKGDDGIIKFVLKDGPIGYKYKIVGPVQFAVDNLFLFNQDISKVASSIITLNWRFFIDNFGAAFFDTAFDIIGGYEKDFFKSVPASLFLKDDLEPFLI